MILRDDGSRARQVVPLTTLPPFGSQDPLDLYKWLDDYESKTHGQAMALAHNGNLSNGWMFPVVDKFDEDKPLDDRYLRSRSKWEPLAEVTYADLMAGSIEVRGRRVPTTPLSSLPRAREIAATLKEWITSGSFTLGEPQIGLPSTPWPGALPEQRP